MSMLGGIRGKFNKMLVFYNMLVDLFSKIEALIAARDEGCPVHTVPCVRNSDSGSEIGRPGRISPGF